MLCKAFCGGLAWMLATIFLSFNALGNSMTYILSGSGNGPIANIITTITDWIKQYALPYTAACGMGITIMFFLMGLAELAASERMNIDTFMKFFAKLMVGIMLCALSPSIFQGVLDMGTKLDTIVENINTTSMISIDFDVQRQTSSSMDIQEDPDETLADENLANIDLSTETVSDLQKKLKDALVTYMNAKADREGTTATGAAFSALFSMFIPFIGIELVMLVMEVITWMLAFTRLLEICVRGMFLPIGLSLMSDDGWHGAGGRYLKKFIAVVCQSAVLIAIAKITTLILTSAATGMVTNLNMSTIIQSLLVMVMVAIACVSVMFKSVGICNDIFGA